MKTHLVLFLCLSVLLSSCISGGARIDKPEPDSGKDRKMQTMGTIFDIVLIAPFGLFAGGVIEIALSFPRNKFSPGAAVGYGAIATLLVAIPIIYYDLSLRDALPYRRAYYEKKKAEEEAESQGIDLKNLLNQQ